MKKQEKRLMACGHPESYVVMADEGTGYCYGCEMEGRLEAVKADLQGASDILLQNGCFGDTLTEQVKQADASQYRAARLIMELAGIEMDLTNRVEQLEQVEKNLRRAMTKANDRACKAATDSTVRLRQVEAIIDVLESALDEPEPVACEIATNNMVRLRDERDRLIVAAGTLRDANIYQLAPALAEIEAARLELFDFRERLDAVELEGIDTKAWIEHDKKLSEKNHSSYVPQGIAIACSKLLQQAGMGKAGLGNTLFAMVHEVVDRLRKADAKNEQLKKAIEAVEKACELEMVLWDEEEDENPSDGAIAAARILGTMQGTLDKA